MLVPPTPQRKPHKLWLPNRAVYGLRVSPGRFQEHVVGCLARTIWSRAQLDKHIFHHPSTKSLLSAHADDIVLAVARRHLEQVTKEFGGEMVIRWEEPLGAVWRRYLGHEWRRVPRGSAVRMPSVFYDRLLHGLGLQSCRPVKAPTVDPKTLREDTSAVVEVGLIKVYRT